MKSWKYKKHVSFEHRKEGRIILENILFGWKKITAVFINKKMSCNIFLLGTKICTGILLILLYLMLKFLLIL